MANNTLTSDLPPLPSYTLHDLPSLVPYISDASLTAILPVIAYWIPSMIFHVIDTYDCFPQYRLHTPAELSNRNHVSRWECFRDVVFQQVIQASFSLVLAFFEPLATYGKDEYNVAVWAQRIRIAQRGIPVLLSLVGVNAGALAQKMDKSSPTAAAIIAGGRYPWLQQTIVPNGQQIIAPAFSAWEMFTAQAVYWYVIPALQFVLAIIWLDTWQYFWHRAMHMNKWLYTTFHSRHHRLYVPYAYGALYNHPFEGFLLDTLGAGLGYLVAGMTQRQAMWFFSCCTIKTVDDHCGYALPFDPIQHITSNNAPYHDIHHQSWGIKTNFSQPFFTFWDGFLGTMWVGGDVSARYARTRIAAEKKMAQEQSTKSLSGRNMIDSVLADDHPYEHEAENATLLTSEMEAAALPKIPPGKATAQAIGSREQVLEDHAGGGATVLAEETAEEERELQRVLRRSPRKKTPSTAAQTGSLKGLRDRVDKSLHGRRSSVLGVESSR